MQTISDSADRAWLRDVAREREQQRRFIHGSGMETKFLLDRGLSLTNNQIWARNIDRFTLKHQKGTEILFRQIAGALARRIVWYCKEGDTAQQCGEMGFIKFGSRVDLFLPIGTKLNVKIGDVVIGSQNVIGEI